MHFGVLFTVALAFSVGLVVGCALWSLWRARATCEPKKEIARRLPLTPFQCFLACFFIGGLLVFFPAYLATGEGHWLIRGLRAVFSALYSTVRLFLAEGDLEVMELAMAGVPADFSFVGRLYLLYATALTAVAPVMTAGFVLSFFKNFSAFMRYTLSRARSVYYISDLNETSMALANDIFDKHQGGRPLIVFFNVFDSEDAAGAELIDQAHDMGAVLFSKDITEIGLGRRRATRKLYFIAPSDDENVRQALTLIGRAREVQALNTPDTEFYVFATSVESEALLDAVDNGHMRVRRVNEKRNLVMGALLDYPIFDTSLTVDGYRQLNVLIVGSGSYGDEFLKSICWCAQLPGYRVSLHVIDRIADARERLAATAPELIAGSGKQIAGEPYYELHFYPNVDVKTDAFAKTLGGLGPLTAAFVTLGNDELNIEIAMRLRAELGRLQQSRGYAVPHIFSVVYNTVKTDTLAQCGGLKSLGKESYGITFIGDMRTRYSLAVIEQRTLEEKGLDIHLAWLSHEKEQIVAAGGTAAEIDRKIAESREAYEKFEYYRRASIATAVHVEVLKKLGLHLPTGTEQAVLEHNRWSAFMRAEGYVFDSAARSHIAKTHPDLKPFAGLGEREKAKDDVAAKREG
ncbi:MAG: hypothetical protein E7639_01485 [Ruminococcaceae bacterium]|nr:hypothetical protein [Oscillospiraceae bacterium]